MKALIFVQDRRPRLFFNKKYEAELGLRDPRVEDFFLVEKRKPS